ncbi:MAG: hypothetical protein JO119_10210 [Acidobacteria bacterium]|nr:hypothetical protein [Acidobacteriota bacterium]
MISITFAILICSVVMLSLALLATRGSSVRHELAFRTDLPVYDEATGDPSLCPPEFAARIFSPADWTFVSAENSPEVSRLFRHERRVVALVWVHQTKAAIHRIMREHTRMTRQSVDLNLATEAKLLSHYLQLLAICDVLVLAIRAAGPARVGALGTYAASLSHSFADAQHALTITIAARDLRGAN